MTDVNTDSKTRKPHRWKPGESGNPNGKPKGSRHKATQMAQEMIGAESEAVIRKVIEKALDGDVACLRLCLERLAPAMKDRPVNVELPVIHGAEDAVTVMGALLAKVSEGEITPSEAVAMTGIVETYRRTIETSEFEKRIAALEEGLKK